MLNKLPTTDELTTQLGRAEAIAQTLARQRDQFANQVAVLEVDLLMERQKVEQQAKELEQVRKELAEKQAPDQPPGDPAE